MKPLKLSFALILIGSALLLSAASESAESLNLKEAQPQSKEPKLQQTESANQQAPIDKPLTIEQFPHSPSNRPTTEDQTSKKEAQPRPPTDSTSRFNLLIAIFTGCLVFVGIGQIIVYAVQARYMRRGLRLTKRAANAAADNARAAKQAVETTQENIRLDQRAWIGIAKAECPSEIKAGVKPTFYIRIKNGGKTPALKFTYRAAGMILPKDKPFEPVYREMPKPPSVFDVHPGIETSMSTTFDVLSDTDITTLKNGDRILYIFGEFAYEDVFERAHHGEFCFYLHSDLFAIFVCHSHNQSD